MNKVPLLFASSAGASAAVAPGTSPKKPNRFDLLVCHSTKHSRSRNSVRSFVVASLSKSRVVGVWPNVMAERQLQCLMNLNSTKVINRASFVSSSSVCFAACSPEMPAYPGVCSVGSNWTKVPGKICLCAPVPCRPYIVGG